MSPTPEQAVFADGFWRNGRGEPTYAVKVMEAESTPPVSNSTSPVPSTTSSTADDDDDNNESSNSYTLYSPEWQAIGTWVAQRLSFLQHSSPQSSQRRSTDDPHRDLMDILHRGLPGDLEAWQQRVSETAIAQSALQAVLAPVISGRLSRPPEVCRSFVEKLLALRADPNQDDFKPLRAAVRHADSASVRLLAAAKADVAKAMTSWQQHLDVPWMADVPAANRFDFKARCETLVALSQAKANFSKFSNVWTAKLQVLTARVLPTLQCFVNIGVDPSLRFIPNSEVDICALPLGSLSFVVTDTASTARFVRLYVLSLCIVSLQTTVGALSHTAQVDAFSSIHLLVTGAVGLLYDSAIEILVDAKANVNRQDRNGYSPLLAATLAGNVVYTKCLIEAGAWVATKYKLQNMLTTRVRIAT